MHMVKNSHSLFYCRHADRPPKTKPQVVADYNNFMLGVDKVDQMGTYYSFIHKSVKWWRKVFFWLLEATTINSFIVYKAAKGITSPKRHHIRFRRGLVQSLVTPLVTANLRISRGVHKVERLRPVPHFLKKVSKRKDCCVCSDRHGGKRSTTPYVCETCTTKPAICPGTCFKLYHTKKNYSDARRV